VTDIAASVLARLKNKAAESGRSYQLCLQLFCQKNFSAVWRNPNMLKTIRNFLEQPFMAAGKDNQFTEKWSTTDCKWI